MLIHFKFVKHECPNAKIKIAPSIEKEPILISILVTRLHLLWTKNDICEGHLSGI